MAVILGYLPRGPPCPHQPLPWIKIGTLKIAGGVETLGDSGFLHFFRVVSSDYGKPRTPPGKSKPNMFKGSYLFQGPSFWGPKTPLVFGSVC